MHQQTSTDLVKSAKRVGQPQDSKRCCITGGRNNSSQIVWGLRTHKKKRKKAEVRQENKTEKKNKHKEWSEIYHNLSTVPGNFPIIQLLWTEITQLPPVTVRGSMALSVSPLQPAQHIWQTLASLNECRSRDAEHPRIFEVVCALCFFSTPPPFCIWWMIVEYICIKNF